MRHRALVLGVIFLCFCVESWAKYASHASTVRYSGDSSHSRYRYLLKPKPIYLFNSVIYHSGTHREIGNIPVGMNNQCAMRIIDAYPKAVICKSDLPKREWWDKTLVSYTEYNWTETTAAFTKKYTWDIHTIKKSRVETSTFIRNFMIGVVVFSLVCVWVENRDKRSRQTYNYRDPFLRKRNRQTLTQLLAQMHEDSPQ